MRLSNAIALTQNRVYTGPAQYLSDPTDLLHYWFCRDISRNSGLLGVTLRRTSDGVEADFGFTSAGYLDRAAVLAWAGASAVTVARLWDSAGTQLGPELVPNGDFSDGTTGYIPFDSNPPVLSIEGGALRIDNVGITNGFAYTSFGDMKTGARYRFSVDFVAAQGTEFQVDAGTTFSGSQLAFLAGTQPLTRSTEFVSLDAFAIISLRAQGGEGSWVKYDNLSMREVLTANAVQTTVASQPPLDLTANPLRIAAAAGTSLVATLPAAYSDAIDLRCSGGNVYEQLKTFSAGATYNVVSNQALCERAILAADTPRTDVDAVKRNMARAWRASEVYLGPELLSQPFDFSGFTPTGGIELSGNTITSIDDLGRSAYMAATPGIYRVSITGNLTAVTSFMTIGGVGSISEPAEINSVIYRLASTGPFAAERVISVPSGDAPKFLFRFFNQGSATIDAVSMKAVIGGI